MILFHGHKIDKKLTEQVMLGFLRSFTKAQVDYYQGDIADSSIHVFVNPNNSDVELISELTNKKLKIIIFGHMGASVSRLLGLKIDVLPDDANTWDQCDAAPIYEYSESEAMIHYENLPEGIECHISKRALLRYDFAKEWNNLGFGHVRTDLSMWSITCKAQSTASYNKPLATVYRADEELSVFISLSAINSSEILWVNRAAGLMDSHEFRLLETFICNYKHEHLPCLPLLREIPYGYDAFISMRLDCDEDIDSAYPLFELYRSYNIPFSLALKTDQPIESSDKRLIHDVIENRGSILSHSVNHKVNWGENFDDVLHEAVKSRQDILDITDQSVRVEFAVSPFHQNPTYAIEGLNEAGYKGFIGGIICNDQQYLVSRGGLIATDINIITHSQQCMLHGDCIPQSTNDILGVFKECANYAVKSGAAFGYLDHPFSERYQYGWKNEKQRVDVHEEWINYLKNLGNVLFESEVKMLEFIRFKSNVNIWFEGDSLKIRGNIENKNYSLAYEYKGIVRELSL